MNKRWSAALVCLVAGATAGGYFLSPVLRGQAPAGHAIPKELTSYRDIVKKVLPAVVSIEARAPVHVPGRQPNFRGPGFNNPNVPEEFRRFLEEFGGPGGPFNQGPFGMNPDPSRRLGFGSGFVIDPDGIILTNNHVVAGAEEVTVEFLDGRKFTSRDFKADRKTDIAIVRLKGVKNLPHLVLGDSDQMEIGDRVLAVGAPFGLAGTVTHGIVSAKGRNGINLAMYEDFLQTDAAINPGNSGGPLVNLEGQAIGINAAIKSRSGGFQGVGLAVPSNVAKGIARALIKDGVVRRGYLGVQVRPLAADVAQRLSVPKDTGVVVGEVFEDTPAAKAGLKAGDVITSVGGKAIRDGRALQHLVANLPLKKPVDVAVVRDGKTLTVPVTIEEQPEEFGLAQAPGPQPPAPKQPEAIGVAKVGLELVDLNEELANQLGYKGNPKGALISRVEPGSVAAGAGLRRGMLITRVDQATVTSAASAREALDKASLQKGILLQVRSQQGGANFVLLQASGG
jgi:serine protease Do